MVAVANERCTESPGVQPIRDSHGLKRSSLIKEPGLVSLGPGHVPSKSRRSRATGCGCPPLLVLMLGDQARDALYLAIVAAHGFRSYAFSPQHLRRS